MNLFEQVFLRPGKYHLGHGRYYTLTVDDLAQYTRNTLALINQGKKIPVLSHHVVPGSVEGGPRHTFQEIADSNEYSKYNTLVRENSAVVGHLVDLRQESDGSLVHIITIDDQQQADSLLNNNKIYTSPELRKQFVDRSGKIYGPVIAHIALTNNPRNHTQYPLSLSTESVQISLLEYEPGAKVMSAKTEPLLSSQNEIKDSKLEQLEETVSLESEKVLIKSEATDTEVEQRASSQGEVVESKDKPETVFMEQTVTSDTQLLGDESFPKKSQEVEKEKSASTQESDSFITPAKLTQVVYQESNMNTSEKDGIEREVIDERENRRVRLSDRIRRSKKIPRGLRDRLTTIVDAIQMDDSSREEPSILVSDAVSMLEEALPTHVHLDPEELESLDHPHGEAFFTGDIQNLSDEEAERIAREQLANTGFSSRISHGKQSATAG